MSFNTAKLTILRRLCLIIFSFIASLATTAQSTYFLRGIVRDSISDDPIPYASVLIDDGRGCIADDQGVFEFSVPYSANALHISSMGYNKKIIPIRYNSLNTYAVYLSPSTTQLNEIVVRKAKYSKKNNPAVDFLNRLKDKAPLTDPRRHPFYSYVKYERITLGLNNFTPDDHRSMLARFPFLDEHIDTSAVSGKPYLSLMVKEKFARILFRQNPEASREFVEAMRTRGLDDMLDPDQMRVFFEDILREVDLYQNDINILQNRFVSPLSRIAPDFYKFYLTDTVSIENEQCIVLSFYPHNHASFGFMGHVYVPVGDSTMFIRRVEMHIPREINLNFIDNLNITQTFRRAPDGSRLKVSDQLTIELSVLGQKNGMFLYRSTSYDKHSFDPIDSDYFSGSANTIIAQDAEQHDDQYWDAARLSAISRGESLVGRLLERMRADKFFYWTEQFIRTMFTGYKSIGNNSPFDIGPLNAFLSFNSTENTRIRLGGMTTANLSKRWFARFFTAYGFKDHKWKYGAEIEYSFIDKKYHSREFPMRSMRFSSGYDIERPGRDFLFTTADNIVLSLKRMTDDRVLYKRTNRIEFNFECDNQFSVCAAAEAIRREPSATMQLIDGFGTRFGHINENAFEITLRYAPGEKIFQTRSYRIPVNLDAPAIMIRHTFAPKGLGGAKFNVNTTEIDIQKRWWFSAFGYLDTYISGGHVWSKTSFLNLLIPNANLSYIIEPRSFALLNPMEFINSSYAAFDFTYWANGALFNFIPYLKNLKLREVFGFRGLWGHLDDKFNPNLHPDLLQFPADAGITKMNHGPYLEASVGIENIFKVLRVDYVWRLNYKNVPYEIDRSGIRIAVHVTF